MLPLFAFADVTLPLFDSHYAMPFSLRRLLPMLLRHCWFSLISPLRFRHYAMIRWLPPPPLRCFRHFDCHYADAFRLCCHIFHISCRCFSLLMSHYCYWLITPLRHAAATLRFFITLFAFLILHIRFRHYYYYADIFARLLPLLITLRWCRHCLICHIFALMIFRHACQSLAYVYWYAAAAIWYYVFRHWCCFMPPPCFSRHDAAMPLAAADDDAFAFISWCWLLMLIFLLLSLLSCFADTPLFRHPYFAIRRRDAATWLRDASLPCFHAYYYVCYYYAMLLLRWLLRRLIFQLTLIFAFFFTAPSLRWYYIATPPYAILIATIFLRYHFAILWCHYAILIIIAALICW